MRIREDPNDIYVFIHKRDDNLSVFSKLENIINIDKLYTIITIPDGAIIRQDHKSGRNIFTSTKITMRNTIKTIDIIQNI